MNTTTFVLVIHAPENDVLKVATALRAKADEWAIDNPRRMVHSGEVATNMLDVIEALILYHERTR